MTYQQLKKKTEGFTIIEVLIVLAIAGLIMLIVFLAVPALQRNQRNNARNSEASRISAAATECLANRNGVAASCSSLSALGLTTSGTPAVLDGYQQFTNVTFPTGAPSTTGSQTAPEVKYGYKCANDGASAGTGNSRDFVVIWQNETNVFRCIGSQ